MIDRIKTIEEILDLLKDSASANSYFEIGPDETPLLMGFIESLRKECAHGIGPGTLSDEIGVRGTFVCPACGKTVTHPEPTAKLYRVFNAHLDAEHPRGSSGPLADDNWSVVQLVDGPAQSKSA